MDLFMLIKKLQPIKFQTLTFPGRISYVPPTMAGPTGVNLLLISSMGNGANSLRKGDLQKKLDMLKPYT
jgi:hypothetical protein